MRSQKNASGLTPVELGEGNFGDFLVTIWDRVKQGNLIKIRKYVSNSNGVITNKHINQKTTMYHINMQTFYLQNTPLHVALISGIASTIKTVL
jgi:hypothetical protein